MRIAYYVPAWPAPGVANGIVTYVDTMRRQLTADGHDVDVIVTGQLYAADGDQRYLRPQDQAQGVWGRIARRIDYRRGDLPIAGMRLARDFRCAHRSRQFDIVEMEESFGWSRPVQRQLAVPVVTRLHGPQFFKAREAVAGRAQRQAAQREAAEGRAICRSAAVSAPTMATLARTQSHYRHHLACAAVIPNPVRVDEDAPRWRASRDRDTILFVGRIDHLKGADTIIDAFAKVAQRRSQVQLIMVGPKEGLPLPDGRFLAAEDYLEWRLGGELAKRVTLTGTLAPAEIMLLRRRAAIAVVASRYETFCFAAIEAMAAASPVICTDWEGSSELIADGETGWRTPVGSSEPLADRIEWLLDHPDEAEEVGRAAWHHCRQTYSPELIARRSLDFYREVLARHGRN